MEEETQGSVVPEMELRDVVLRGRFLTLEPLKVAHVAELYPDAMEPGIFQHLAPGAEASRADLQAWIGRRLEEKQSGTAIPFLQRDAVTRKAFGCTTMFNVSKRHHRLEIGHTWLAKSHRKTPANTEAKLLLLTHAFEEMRAVRVQFKVDERNEAGIRALERIGAVREGLMRSERILADGFIRNAYVYSIIDPEWPAVKVMLNGMLMNRAEPAVPMKAPPPRIPGLNDAVTPPPGVLKILPEPKFEEYHPPAVQAKPVGRRR